jgi:tRNA 2-thiouridine synthesizing protein A|tara:strand:+ start:1021 stop:1251 length:231 start_codon:yes stop_codon:yes gene_type:complete
MIKKGKLIDLKGLRCPLPVLKIAKKINQINKGEFIEVEVDDPKAENDINELTKNIGIKIIEKKKEKKFIFFKIKKL